MMYTYTERLEETRGSLKDAEFYIKDLLCDLFYNEEFDNDNEEIANLFDELEDVQEQLRDLRERIEKLLGYLD